MQSVDAFNSPEWSDLILVGLVFDSFINDSDRSPLKLDINRVLSGKEKLLDGE